MENGSAELKKKKKEKKQQLSFREDKVWTKSGIIPLFSMFSVLKLHCKYHRW